MPPRSTRAEILADILREQREHELRRARQGAVFNRVDQNPFNIRPIAIEEMGTLEESDFFQTSNITNNATVGNTLTRNNNRKYMKREHHYSREERDDMHNPATDWCETKRGEKCINACSLVIDDILSKVKETSVGGTVQ